MVRRETVRAAVRAGVRPSGAPVPATGEHPAGLQVYGLGGVGALRDGDVITRVGGATPRSLEDVIGVVAGAYRAKSYMVSGEFWRDGEKIFDVTDPEPLTRGWFGFRTVNSRLEISAFEVLSGEPDPESLTSAPPGR